MAVPIQRHPTVPASTLSEVKRIQKIVADTIRSYVGGNGMHSGMREKQVRCFRTVAVEVQNTGTDTGTAATAKTYPKYPANVFPAEMGRPFFVEQAGLQPLEFKPYAGPMIRYLMDPFGNYRVEGEVVFAQLIHGQWFIIGGNHEFMFRARMTTPLRGLAPEPEDDPIDGVTTFKGFTDFRRLPDNAPIPYENPSQLVGTGTTEKGIYITNSKNHRAAKDAAVYLVKNNVIDLPSSTGTGTASSPFTNATGTSSDNNAGPDRYTQNVPKIVYFDVVDVPLRAFEAVNHMQTFKVLTDNGGSTYYVAEPTSSDAGVIIYAVQSIMAEYDEIDDINIAPQTKKRCPLITFGPCDVTLDADTLLASIFADPNEHPIDIRGDSDPNSVQYQSYRFDAACLPSIYTPTGTATSTATSTASA